MFLFRSAFWMGKSESLVQELVAALIKTVLIAALAFVVMDHAKRVLELYDKRRALVHFQNSTLEGAISDLQDSYAQYLGCTASVARFKGQDCLDGLASMQVALDSQEEFVSGILGSDTDDIGRLASTIDALVEAYGEAQKGQLDSAELKALSDSAKAALRSAIVGLAQEIR